MLHRTIPLVLTLALLGAVGCARPLEPTTPTVARVEAATPEDYGRLWDAAAQSLREQFFRLDRQDRTNGVLSTVPETSASWFELWRPQPDPGYYWWESNLSTVQRQVVVRLQSSATQPGNYDVDVEVQRLRYSLRERQVDNAAAALRLYSSAAPTTEGRSERASQTSRWIPLGRDQFYEQRLLSDILNRYPLMPLTTQPAQVAAE